LSLVVEHSMVQTVVKLLVFLFVVCDVLCFCHHNNHHIGHVYEISKTFMQYFVEFSFPLCDVMYMGANLFNILHACCVLLRFARAMPHLSSDLLGVVLTKHQDIRNGPPCGNPIQVLHKLWKTNSRGWYNGFCNYQWQNFPLSH
jgi:hypothetical protein